MADSTGKKFGKSEGNALWLDPNKNSPFVIYQYFMNTADEDVVRYLNILTLLTIEEIKQIESKHQQDLSQRVGQQELAYYVTKTVFGHEAAEHTKQITDLLFGSSDKISVISSMNKEALFALNNATGKATVSSPNVRIVEACVMS